MGPPAVPLILKALGQRPDPWFWALQTITGVDPVAPSDLGRINEMADAWLTWGRANGLLD